MKEIWKDIKEYEGRYKISNIGRVYSCLKNKALKIATNKDGYNVVWLHKNGYNKIKRVHRLVAEAFVKNPKNLSQVNHLNEIKSNNNVSNLDWCTQKNNIEYGNNGNKYKQILQIDPETKKELKIWSSVRRASLAGFNKGNLNKALRNKNKTCEGYLWEYLK